MAKAVEQSVEEGKRAEKNRLRTEYIGVKWLGKTPCVITLRAIKMVTTQYRLMLGAVKTNSNTDPLPLKPCTGRFTVQFGIPCSHWLFERHEAKTLVVKKEDFHPF